MVVLILYDISKIISSGLDRKDYFEEVQCVLSRFAISYVQTSMKWNAELTCAEGFKKILEGAR